MSKIKFCEYAQRIRPRTSRKDSQDKFIRYLLFSAGVEGSLNPEGDDVDLPYFYDNEYLRRIYTGRRKFTKTVKDKIMKPIPRQGVIDFFTSYIVANFEATMTRFTVPEAAPKDLRLFCDALCTQFEYLVATLEETAEDIVATEYVRLLQEHDPQGLHNANEANRSDLYKLGMIINKIRELAKLLEDFDFEQGDSPVHALFASIKDINADLPTDEITHKATARAVKELHDQREGFMQFLAKVTTAHDYRAYSHSGKSRSTWKDVACTMNTIQSMRKSLYSAINKVYHAENTLKEEIMLLQGYVPVHIVYGKKEDDTEVSE